MTLEGEEDFHPPVFSCLACFEAAGTGGRDGNMESLKHVC